MKRFKNILLVFDPQVTTKPMVDRARSLARENGARVTLLSVVPQPPADQLLVEGGPSREQIANELAAERLEQCRAMADYVSAASVSATPRVAVGTAFIEVIRTVLGDGQDLVMLTAEAERGFARRLFGSTSLHLMRKCPCPVWVFKPTQGERFARILAAVDTSGGATDTERGLLNPKILQLAASLARIDGSELHVVQAWSVFGEGYLKVRGDLHAGAIRNLRKAALERYRQRIEGLLEPLDLADIALHLHLPRSEDAARAITRLARTERADLLVMGTVCRTGIAGFFIGNTAEKVLGAVDCSVLTVKPDGFVTPVTLEPS
jgi:nucleotide-binding universal stress UspA family protein